jgi:hypothetical protein
MKRKENMKKSASEIIRDLEIRIAKLEKQAYEDNQEWLPDLMQENKFKKYDFFNQVKEFPYVRLTRDGMIDEGKVTKLQDLLEIAYKQMEGLERMFQFTGKTVELGGDYGKGAGFRLEKFVNRNELGYKVMFQIFRTDLDPVVVFRSALPLAIIKAPISILSGKEHRDTKAFKALIK